MAKSNASQPPITTQPRPGISPVDVAASPMTTGFGSGWEPNMGVWKQIPADPVPNCPPGLETLANLDSVFIVQYVEIMEVITNWEMRNKYMIRDAKGENILFATEESGCCCRFCFKHLREFQMHFYNSQQKRTMLIERPYRCIVGCFLQELDIFIPPETMVAVAFQEGWCCDCKPNFTLYGKKKKKLFTVRTPCCKISCCGDVVFDIEDPSGAHVGTIVKKWRGMAQEWFTNADAFRITFPLSMDVTLKAALICLAMLIDYAYFEQK